MATVPTQRFLKPEDFDAKDQALINKLAFPINTFMQQVITGFTNSLDFNNLNMQINTFTASVDVNGVPTIPINFQNALKTKLYGLICINASNQSGTNRVPAAHPFVSWTQSSNTVNINHITGLGIPTGQTNSDSYTFTVLSIGQNVPTA
jgi:hypothetical protein